MTVEEARRQVGTCEEEIKSTYRDFVDTARSVPVSAQNAISQKRMKMVLFPLIFVAFGLLNIILQMFGFGVMLIILGIAISFLCYSIADAPRASIESGAKRLNTRLDDINSI